VPREGKDIGVFHKLVENPEHTEGMSWRDLGPGLEDSDGDLLHKWTALRKLLEVSLLLHPSSGRDTG
jgi:hypothetical protein